VQEPVVVPQLGDPSTYIRVARWVASVGDTVRAGQPLVELETDKATFEIPASADGLLAACHVLTGASVQVGDTLAVLHLGTLSPAALVRPVIPSTAPGQVTWDVRVIELPYGCDGLSLEPGWEPFAVVGPRQILARRPRC